MDYQIQKRDSNSFLSEWLSCFSVLNNFIFVFISIDYKYILFLYLF